MTAENATYFAYGTLLDIDEMHKYCPSAEPVGLMTLKNHRLGFAACAADPKIGGCTLEFVPGYATVGMLYTMPQAEKKGLDKISGLPAGLWANYPVSVIKADGTVVETVTFIIPVIASPWYPPDTYIAHILRGAEALKLAPNYIQQLREIIDSSRGLF